MQRRRTATVPSRHPQAALATEAAYKGPVTDPSALSTFLGAFLFSGAQAKTKTMADARMFTEDDYGYPDRP